MRAYPPPEGPQHQDAVGQAPEDHAAGVGPEPGGAEHHHADAEPGDHPGQRPPAPRVEGQARRPRAVRRPGIRNRCCRRRRTGRPRSESCRRGRRSRGRRRRGRRPRSRPPPAPPARPTPARTPRRHTPPRRPPDGRQQPAGQHAGRAPPPPGDDHHQEGGGGDGQQGARHRRPGPGPAHATTAPARWSRTNSHTSVVRVWSASGPGRRLSTSVRRSTAGRASRAPPPSARAHRPVQERPADVGQRGQVVLVGRLRAQPGRPSPHSGEAASTPRWRFPSGVDALTTSVHEPASAAAGPAPSRRRRPPRVLGGQVGTRPPRRRQGPGSPRTSPSPSPPRPPPRCRRRATSASRLPASWTA